MLWWLWDVGVGVLVCGGAAGEEAEGDLRRGGGAEWLADGRGWLCVWLVLCDCVELLLDVVCQGLEFGGSEICDVVWVGVCWACGGLWLLLWFGSGEGGVGVGDGLVYGVLFVVVDFVVGGEGGFVVGVFLCKLVDLCL